IGEGGMGTVWMADQTEPIKRRVAVKLIRVDRGNSRTILARFEAERQAIALMDHPHIARLLDAGTTDAGQPYFVMDLVKGIPLNEFCDAHKLNVHQRLGLFQQICSAVQHAHQKGIIHRDLKPTNVLVEDHEGKPVPKVIDFGLAKATSGLQLTEHSLFTAFGSVMGTPLYMAPEQAGFNATDVDTRADVYALGVILYELLTGSTPLTSDTLKRAALDEVLKLVREQEAPTPSSRLSSAGSLPSVAANRQTEPGKLGRFVKGELDWIVLKALSKERDRRYESANGFARDIERFLAHEPVSAGPPSSTYKLWKFARRNRGQVIAASLVLFALLAGIAGTTWGLVEAKRQQKLAVAAQVAESERAEGERSAKLVAEAKTAEAERAKVRAEAGEKLASDRLIEVEAQKKIAVEETQIAQAVRDFLQNKLLAQADTTAQADTLLKAGESSSGAKWNPTIRELLDRAARELAPDRIEANFPKQPLTQAAILDTIGKTYLGIGEDEPAIDFLKRTEALHRKHLGPAHPDTLTSMNDLADAYYYVRKYDLALPLFKETLKLRNATLGPEHPSTLESMGNLAATYLYIGNRDLALPLLVETVTLKNAILGPEHPDTLSSTDNLASANLVLGKYDLALSLFEETLKLRKAKLGPEHPSTLESVDNLAWAYATAGKHDLALSLFKETVKFYKVKLGPEHPFTIRNMNNLTSFYLDVAAKQAWLDQGTELAATCQKVLLVSKDTDNVVLAERMAKVCSLRPSDDQTHEAALVLARRAVELGKGHPYLPYFQMALGMAEYRSGHFAEADAALLAAATLGTNNAFVTGTSALYRAMTLFRQGQATEAEKLATEAVAKMKPLPADETNPLAGNAYHDDLILWLAYKEAKEMIRFKAVPPPTVKDDAK
ncbi:MAG: tetratricopeptide repeat protein, partial [Isosphaeraceae bacterium]